MLHGWDLGQALEVSPNTNTHTPRPAVSWAQSLALQAVGCRSHQASVVVGNGAPLEGATVIKEGALLSAPVRTMPTPPPNCVTAHNGRGDCV